MADLEPGGREGIGGAVQAKAAEDTEGGGVGEESKEGGSVKIDEMPAGREMDAMVAEKVMGWVIDRQQVPNYSKTKPCATIRTLYTIKDGCGNNWSPAYSLDDVALPRYSTDIAASWMVAEKLEMPFGLHKAYKEVWGVGQVGWLVNWCSEQYCSCRGDEADGRCESGNEVWAETAPLAICRAALKTKEATQCATT